MSEHLGTKIKGLRMELGLTLEEFGKLVFNTTKSNVHKWENNITKPSTKNLRRIAELANVSFEEFLAENNIESLVFEVNFLISENERLENQLQSYKQELYICKGTLDSIFHEHTRDLEDDEKIVFPEEVSSEISKLSNEIANLERDIDTISDEILLNAKKIHDMQNEVFKNTISTKIFQSNLTPLEKVFTSSHPLTINKKVLTAEDKIRALEILKLVFK